MIQVNIYYYDLQKITNIQYDSTSCWPLGPARSALYSLIVRSQQGSECSTHKLHGIVYTCTAILLSHKKQK